MTTTGVYYSKKKKDDEEYKREKGGCETALLPASFSMHCLWFVGDMKTAYAASRCQQNHNLCMLAFGRVADNPF